MVDIEFLAQYLVLSNAYKYPEILTRWSDNVRIIESCVDCQLISPEDACKLKQAYLNIRDKAHHRSLRGQERTVSNQHLGDERNFVIDFWNKTMGADLF
jgi:glutamate-ammonia-ligase adenylyltransferase